MNSSITRKNTKLVSLSPLQPGTKAPKVPVGVSIDDALLHLANRVCDASPCMLLAAKHEIEPNGANAYTSFHRRKMQKGEGGQWVVASGSAWDKPISAALALLAGTDAN